MIVRELHFVFVVGTVFTMQVFSSVVEVVRVERLMSLTIFLPWLFVVFLIVHSFVATMSSNHSLSK